MEAREHASRDRLAHVRPRGHHARQSTVEETPCLLPLLRFRVIVW